LGKEERLKSRKLIERIFREGRSFALFPFRVYYLSPAELPAGAKAEPHRTFETSPHHPGQAAAQTAATQVHARVHLQAGFGASSRNFKKAVDRNRIKRLTREAYRLQRQTLQEGLEAKDISLAVFFIYTGKELPDYGVVRDRIGVALSKLVKEIGV
jgi:ribonuclease P protein component